MNNKKLTKPSPLKYWQLAIAVGQLAMSAHQSAKRNRLAREALRQQNIKAEEEAEALEKEMGRYKSMTFKNPYAENVYEDITISKESAEFQMEQAAQQRADIMQGLSGAAGTSGIAGLAQSLAVQGAMQARQASADIAKQEAYNQKLIAQGAQQVQRGEDWVQQMEIQRKQDLLMARLGGVSGARQAQQRAQANVLSSESLGRQQMIGAVANVGTTAAGMEQTDWDKLSQDWNKLNDSINITGGSGLTAEEMTVTTEVEKPWEQMNMTQEQWLQWRETQ